MKNFIKMILVAVIVALASQINISIINSDFKVSAGIILFIVSLFLYEELKPVPAGIISGITDYISRIILYYLSNGMLDNAIISYLFEILFYVFYSIIYSFFSYRANKDNVNLIFLIIIISDFVANLMELFIRDIKNIIYYETEVIVALLVVSLARSIIVWFLLNIIKFYKLLLLKEEHEDRYRKLLWITSQVKTEMYWIEKNMNNIEFVMKESYNLFEKINNNKDIESWGENSLNIAKSVHEIKKEHGLLVRGLKEILDNEFDDKGMKFSDIINILHDTMKREIRLNNKNIELIFSFEKDFYTRKHYHLMSTLRNLIMNAVDAINNKEKKNKIELHHHTHEELHRFIISDTGEGIHKNDMEFIFSPGYSTKINYSTGEINRGLGLSIVKNIVEEELGGKINVSSSLGKGTNFYIEIPKEELEDKENEDIYS